MNKGDLKGGALSPMMMNVSFMGFGEGNVKMKE